MPAKTPAAEASTHAISTAVMVAWALSQSSPEADASTR